MENMTFKTLEEVHSIKQDNTYLWDVIDTLRKEIKELKVKLNNGENCDHEWYNDLKDVIKSLEEENDSLKDEAVKWNRKYNKLADNKLLSCDDDCQDTINYCNKLKAENKELEKRYKYFLKEHNIDVGCNKDHEYVDNVFDDTIYNK